VGGLVTVLYRGLARSTTGGARNRSEVNINTMLTERFTNHTRKALKRGEKVVGTMSSHLAFPEAMQMCAMAGLDFVIIDSEHSPYDIFTVRQLISAARLSGITPFVRVPDAQYHLIARSLDAGAMGVMVPRVETKETVEEVVASVKYPPMGRRGCGSIDIQNDFFPVTVAEHVGRANDESLVIIQIESTRAVAHVDELLSVPGVDVALIGPADLSISMGIPGEWRSEPFIKEVTKILDACKKAGVASGIHLPDFETVEFWAQRGMPFLMCSSDVAQLAAGISQLGKRMVGLKGPAGK